MTGPKLTSADSPLPAETAVRVSGAPVFAAWLDAFFAAYYRRRPVNATFIGMHAYDDRLPDLSEAGSGDLAADAAELLARLRQLPAEPLSSAERMDYQLAQGFLEIQAWEATSAHFAWGNPSLHTGEAVWSVLSLLLRPFARLSERLEGVLSRLDLIPGLLADGRATLHDVPAEWSGRARRECSGARLLLQDGLDRLLREANTDHPGVRRTADRAVEAFARFDSFLESLPPAAAPTSACGPEAFDLLLRRGHFLDLGAVELEQLALERMAEAEAAIALGGPPLNSARPDAYLERFSELWRAMRDLAERDDLLTFPDWPVRYVEQPAWVRDAAPAFYFLPYRAPAPFDASPSVDYFVPPMADDSTIKLNHVVHHGSLGHHVQNWHAGRARSRVGQLAAVDCASRIAMLCGGTLAEGWACYATDLAEEHGFLTPAERFAQHTARLRMAARAVVDIRLHQGRITLDQAAELYRQRVGMSDGASRSEAIKNSLFPGAACMYLAGWDAIWRLRRQFAERQTLSLRQFHDLLLSFGSVPVSLVGKSMREANSNGARSTSPTRRSNGGRAPFTNAPGWVDGPA